MNDPIVDEVRRVREEYAAQFNYDLWAIFRDIKEQQHRSGLAFVSFVTDEHGQAPREVTQPTETANSQAVIPSIPEEPRSEELHRMDAS